MLSLVGLIGCTQSAANFFAIHKGNTSYANSNTHSLQTTITGEYNLFLYKPSSARWECSLAGKIHTDYDHFNKKTKTNVFTTIQVDF